MASTQTASITRLSADLPLPAGATAVRRRDTSYFSREFSATLGNPPRPHGVRQGIDKPSDPRFFFFFSPFIFISWRLITSQHFSGFCHTLT